MCHRHFYNFFDQLSLILRPFVVDLEGQVYTLYTIRYAMYLSHTNLLYLAQCHFFMRLKSTTSFHIVSSPSERYKENDRTLNRRVI